MYKIFIYLYIYLYIYFKYYMYTIVFNVITYFHSIFNMSYFHTDWLLGLPVIGMYITGKSSNKSVSYQKAMLIEQSILSENSYN